MGERRERRAAYRLLLKKLEGKNHSENQVVVGRIILNWIFKMWDR
jgi:hypothetical protein